MQSHSSYLGTAATEAPTGALDTFAHRMRALAADARGLVRDHALLALLEVQRASLGLVKIIGAAVVISVLAVSAWMGLVAAGVAWAVGAGASWAVAIVIAAALNLVGAAVLAWWIKAQVPELLFAATVRQLKGEPPAADQESPADAGSHGPSHGGSHAQ